MSFEDTYRKKLSRLLYWEKVEQILGNIDGFVFLALAGPDAGDLSTLLGLGAEMEQVVLVDKDAKAVESSKWKFPKADVRHGELLEVVGKDEKFDAVFLDFCSNLKPEVFDYLAEVVKSHLAEGGVFGINILSGREAGEMRETLDKAGISLRGQYTDKSESAYPYLTRCAILHEQLTERLGWSPEPALVINYASIGKDRQGVPMLTVLYKKAKGKKSFVPRSYESMLQTISVDEPAFRKDALELAKKRDRVDLLLNIPRGTLAAWKAHDTRGTYKRGRGLFG